MAQPPETMTPVKEVLLDHAEAAPLMRLTRDELSHTLRDLKITTQVVGDGFPEDAVGPTGFYAPGIMSELEAKYLLEATEQITKALSPQMPTLFACDAGRDEMLCARQFIERFGKRAYRRPLEASEVDELLRFFSSAKTTLRSSTLDAARLTMQAMLQSPNFLYHRESGARHTLQDGVVTLDSYGVASRLSYFLWGSMPDDTLMRAADEGRLATESGVAEQVRRLMAHSNFKDTLKAFHFQWLGIKDLKDVAKDPRQFPQFSPQLVKSMERETLEFVTDVLATDGKFKTLLTAQHTFVDSELAKIYGLPTDGLTPGNFARVTLQGKNRSGVLTQPSFLAWGATTTDPLPPRRGLKILEQFLCRVPPPPPDMIPPPPPAGPMQTNRNRFEEHLKNGCAQACHGLIDPLGFGFENYDAIGQYRTSDNGRPVDASGMVQLSDDGAEHRYNNAVELSRVLAESPEVAACVTRKWFRFALGRMDKPGDGVQLKKASDGFLVSDTDLRALITVIAQSKAFSRRLPSEGEVIP